MTDDVAKLGTILCVFAHPDDETFTMGGIIAAARKNGQRVIVVTATRGEGGVQDESRWPRENLGEIRTQELAAALKILSVEHHFYLDILDGACADADADETSGRIARLIDTYQPDSIMTFGPDGLTGHPDHRTVSVWASRAKKLSGSQAKLHHAALTPEQYDGFRAVDADFNFFFNTDKPPICEPGDTSICITLDDELFGKKMAALAAMPSQYDGVLRRFSSEDLRGGFGIEAFAEG